MAIDDAKQVLEERAGMPDDRDQRDNGVVVDDRKSP
jgi:hypothetical protein